MPHPSLKRQLKALNHNNPTKARYGLFQQGRQPLLTAEPFLPFHSISDQLLVRFSPKNVFVQILCNYIYLYSMKSTHIVISLDTRKKKKDGTYPLVMRVGHINRTTAIPLKISLHIKDWDEEKRHVKNSYTGTESVTPRVRAP